MDPEHRHELQQNDLEAFLRNATDWIRRRGLHLLLMILLAVLAGYGVYWLRTKHTRLLETAHGDLAHTTSPDGLMDVADSYQDVPAVRAQALLKAADQLHQEAVFGSLSDPSAQPPGPEERKEMLQKARDAYRRVIEEVGEPELMVLNARLGLAAAHESLGEFDEAEAQYQAIIDSPGQYGHLARQAEQRMAALEELREPVQFAKAPEQTDDTDGSDASKKGQKEDRKGGGASEDADAAPPGQDDASAEEAGTADPEASTPQNPDD